MEEWRWGGGPPLECSVLTGRLAQQAIGFSVACSSVQAFNPLWQRSKAPLPHQHDGPRQSFCSPAQGAQQQQGRH